MATAFLLGALASGVITGLVGYLIGSKVPDFQERAVEYQYKHQHKNCKYTK